MTAVMGLGIVLAVWAMAGFAYLFVLNMRYSQRQHRLQAVRRFALPHAGRVRSGFSLVASFRRFGIWLEGSGFIPAGTLAEMRAGTQAHARSGEQIFHVFLGIKVFLLLLGCVLFIGCFFLLGHGSFMHILLPVAFPVLGLVASDMVLSARYKRYLTGVERGMPDALDLLVICVEAGMPAEVAIARVAREMGRLNADVANEFRMTVQDMQVMPDRYEVFKQMARRTGLPVMKQLSSVLVQSFELGTPLAEAFRTLAADMKQEAVLRYQTQVAQLPVFMTLPMILFILPVLFIIVLAPVVLKVLS